MPRRTTSTRTPQGRRPRRSKSGSRSRAALPNARFWSELLATLKELRAEVRRLGTLEAGAGPARHLDWARFQESREAAREGRERYWRETGTAK